MAMEANAYEKSCVGHKLRNRWRQMIARCENPKRKDYKYYGGKGVVVCKAWHDYPAFLKWFYNAVIEEGSYRIDKLSIDRIDENGGYNSVNCRLILKSENSRRAKRSRGKNGRFIKMEVNA